MAKQFGSQLDLQKIPVVGLVAEQKATAPTSPVNGQLWYDTTNGVTKCYDSGAWVLVGNVAGGSTPTGPAGGDLTGSTYPNPVIANLAVTAAKIASATITDAQVAAANKDGAPGTASLRTLGSGAQQALPGNTTRLTLGAVGKYAANNTAWSAGTPATITHSLNTTDVQAGFNLVTGGAEVIFDWKVVDANSISVTADVAYSAGTVRVIVVG